MIGCHDCHYENPDAARFCEGCGRELQDPRRATHRADEVEAEFLLDQVKKARTAFLIVGAALTVGGLLEAAMAPAGMGAIVLAINGVALAMFLGLAWWAGRQPFAAAVVGLFLFAGMQLLGAIEDPSTLYKGILIKVIVIVMLVRAVRAGFSYRQFVRSRGMG